ncbi:hypothetical protein HETIRDRAFT_418066 [Heterobasidion irregulare TC 32-1]|uniref:CoA-transferase family III n=1 Tax=Heterobasidion irregulare (strain TC 32-1) TaxID=747525 RepID=W4K8J1_HETIT|nr:uncharacterized protein HETIRDRAFT_418066 [Heterobasidion irregulare TC 32-1]ETW82108.1 hypothetical protein HETIRDRAFT_418066 [Heterobasidion irregulare TC 32-1]
MLQPRSLTRYLHAIFSKANVTDSIYDSHKQGLVDILKCAPTKAAVAAALASWSSIDFEAEVMKRNLCAVAVRSFEEADRHPHARQTVNNESVYVRKIGDAPRRILSGTEFARALDGIRVLDLTRVLAGPVCGRTLAAHGADTLLVTSPNLPSLPLLDMDTSRGKRTTQLDLRDPKDKETLQSLVKDADVFLQAYRPGGLQGLGFGPEEVAKARPGIVYGTLSAYGFSGALKDAKGFDSLLQAIGGMNVAEAQAYKDYVLANGGNVNDFPPHRSLPMQALDHATGYLLAFGIISALCRTITEGGSYEVHVSLGATLHWVRSLGYLSPEEAYKNGEPLPPRGVPLDTEVAGFSTKIEQAVPDAGVQSGPVYHNITAIRHAAVMSKTKVCIGEAPMRLDAHLPVWLKRP